MFVCTGSGDQAKSAQKLTLLASSAIAKFIHSATVIMSKFICNSIAFVSQTIYPLPSFKASVFGGHETNKSKTVCNTSQSSQKSQRASVKATASSNHTNNSHDLLNRRQVLSLIASLPLALKATIAQAAPNPYEKVPIPPYDAMKTRRYVGVGRPPSDRPAPEFESDKKVFTIDEDLYAQDVQLGDGDEQVEPGSLVVARWALFLEDGTLVDVSNERQPAMFRPGAHQVPPGVEDSVLGMSPGGKRRVKGTARRILSNVVLGYNIGERSPVPNDSTLFLDVTVDRINPYGTGR